MAGATRRRAGGDARQRLGGGRGRGKASRAAGRLTKRERDAFNTLARDGLVGLGAVDPSPQRTAVAVAACLYLLLG